MACLPAWIARSGSLVRGLTLALLLAACAPPRPAAQRPLGQPAAQRPSLRVVTTFLPITLFTRAVAGDCATVTALIPPNLGPHDFQAKPGDLAALRQARVLVKNGLQMETFLEDLVAGADNPSLKVIDSSRGIATLSREHATPDPHPADGHAPTHTQGNADGHTHAHGPVNPHIWLDPLRAVQQVETIRDGLIQADPGCAAVYRRNAAVYTAELRRLNQEIAAQLRPYRGKTFLAFHDVAPYFAQRYGLRADFVVDGPELNPSPADLQRVSAQVQRSQLKALLGEPQQGNRSFHALAADLGVPIRVFDPMETGSEAASRDPATYGVVLRRNGAELRRAFGG
jgi:zinc transport system substrate-binding protein